MDAFKPADTSVFFQRHSEDREEAQAHVSLLSALISEICALIVKLLSYLIQVL
jgi:hypothetical protein